MDLYEKIGFNFLYHYNPFNKQHSCIDRNDYVNFWNGKKEWTALGWTSGDTIEEAQLAMLKRIEEQEG